jgi:hypothetical protein
MGQPGNPNVIEAGRATRWKPGQKPPGAGRKPSKLKKYIKAVDFSSDDLERLLKNLFANHTLEEIKAMAQNGKLPAIVWGFVVAWMSDVRKGGTGGGFISQMMERAFGKVKQEIEYSGGLSVDTMTAEERQIAITELLEKRAKENEKENFGGSENGTIETNSSEMHGGGNDSLESSGGISGDTKEAEQSESGETKTENN